MSVTQETIFSISHHVMLYSDFKHTGHLNPKELIKRFSDEEAIETYINFYGTSDIAYQYGWWKNAIPRLVEVYGERLRPYCELRIQEPLHGGGTAYGEAYLERSKNLCRLFCELVIQAL